MKSITIKKMSFVNFKGLRELTVDFKDSITEISGANGLGKSSIFDGFTWVLFGKDSHDDKKFHLKTIDADNNIIPKLPHEVTVWLDIDGSEIILCRRLNEKWTKKRGESEETFTGNEEERLWNDVPCSVREWNDKIQSLCSEDVFKFITNPLYFSSQKSDIQRTMLFRMAGGISDSDIANGNSDFKALLASITGKTMEEYKKEVQAKKRRLKTEIDAIPERIDERKRDAETAEDWNALIVELDAKKKEMNDIQEQINDKTKAYMEKSNERQNLSHDLIEVRQKISVLANQINEKVYADYNAECKKKSELLSACQSKKAGLSLSKGSLERTQKDLDSAIAQRETLIEEWKAIKREQLTFKEDEFVCPTCKRPFDVDKIEAMQQTMTENFNGNKAERLKENENRGKEIKQDILSANSQIEKTGEEIRNAEKQIAEIEANPLYSKTFEAPDSAPAFEADAEYQKLCKQREELAKAIEKPITIPDTNELKGARDGMSEWVEELKSRLAKKDVIERNNARISELEKQFKTQSEEYAELERIEFVMKNFAKAKIEAVENKINGMFRFVKFKMYEQQINGGEIETCEATANGIPYSSLSNAQRINAGLDIINAISKNEQITAPIFIDNSEAVNELEATKSQIIRLVVTNDNKLTIK